MGAQAGELDEQQRAILDLEKRRFKYQGAKERAIGAQLGMPVTEYYQRLNALIDRDDAARFAPMLISRLRRARLR